MTQIAIEAPSKGAHKPWYAQLYFQVLLAIAAGALIGYFQPGFAVQLKPLGDVFIKLVKMVIGPVIFLTIVTGICGMRDLKVFGRATAKAFAYFLSVSTLALIIGLVVGNLVQPGAGMHVDLASLDTAKVADFAAKAHETTITGFLTAIVPDTVVSAFVDGNILQVLFVAITFGIALTLSGDVGQPVVDFLESLSHAFFALVAILMKAAPIGAFGAFAFTIGKFGIGAIISLASLVACFYLTAALFVVIVLGLIARANGFSIFRLLAYLKTELFLVLGTSSSESALPSLMDKMEKAGCAKPIVGLVVPTGYSFNLDGTNIYMTLATLFIAQATGVHLSLGDQLLLLGVAMISSKGAAGVSGAGFITLAATLSVMPSVPVAGMALILGIDRFMSECRALTNFIGNAVATIVVSRWEGALDTEQLAKALRPAAKHPD
jgi:aerobic C4-dicarboxylate transport protein